MEANAAAAGGSFKFVELLAKELSSGTIEVPGFPDVVVRIRRLLDDPDCDAGKVANVIGGEPVLTARLIRIANSAALRPTAGEVTDPRAAVARLGFTMVQSATVSYASEQMRLAQKYESAKVLFDQIWQSSTEVAAVAYVIARKCCRRLNADEALLAGLIHAVGKLYIISRAQDFPDLFEDDQQLVSVMSDWYVPVGESILQSWNFPDSVVQAVASQLDTDREPEEESSIADILHVAVPLPAVLGDEEGLVPVLEKTRAGIRLGLTTNQCVEVLEEAKEQIAELRATLS